ncbi:MAG TPA: SCO family protein [Puia sp.]|nr:SCO family protein [Puia sp.]
MKEKRISINKPSKPAHGKEKINIWMLAVIAVFAGLVFFVFSSKGSILPVLGDPGHAIGSFSFVDQDGRNITDKDVAGKIRVVEYFFTTCKSICPIMNSNLVMVQDAFKEKPDVIILSHTVNPSTDSVPVLKKYAGTMHAIPGKWEFLTGTKVALYQMAQHDYLLSADSTTEANEAGAFIHTQYVALIDKENRIRGFYDATDKKEINKLISDIKKL